MITEPGIYELSHAQYHADPCEPASLSSTGARTLVSKCPAAFRYAPPQNKNTFDIGNACHLLVLTPDEFEGAIRRIDADDYKTKAAREAKTAAYAENRIPLLPWEVEMVEDMRHAVKTHPVARFAFERGNPEKSLIWRDPEFGILCRTRPDWLPAHGHYLIDLKTAMSADMRDFDKAIIRYGYHQQAAWYLDGVSAVLGEMPQRFCFVVVEKTPPYLVSVIWLDEEWFVRGRKLNRRAKGLFAWCLKNNQWPGYQPDITAAPAAFTSTPPEWYVRDFDRRDEAGEFEPPQMMETA